MNYPTGGYNDQRREARVNSELPVHIMIGLQLSFQGHLKDLSPKSAFIRVKNSVYLNIHDEIGFAIQCSSNSDDVIQGRARVSRIVAGEGFALYFTNMDKKSEARLEKLLTRV